jgi:hypothetical protein
LSSILYSYPLLPFYIYITGFAPHILLFPCSPQHFLSPSSGIRSRSFLAIAFGHLLSIALKVEFLLQRSSWAIPLAHLQRCLLFIVSFPSHELLITVQTSYPFLDEVGAIARFRQCSVDSLRHICPFFRRDASRFLTSRFLTSLSFHLWNIFRSGANHNSTV